MLYAKDVEAASTRPLPRLWSPQALAQLRQAIEDASLFQSIPEPVRPQSAKDVLILAPQGGGLFQSTPTDLSESLRDHGVDVRHSIEDVGCSASLAPEQAERLQERGFHVVDDSPLNLLPHMPSFPTHTWTIPFVDPVAMTGADKLHAAGATGKDQIIAILDSGADNPELVDKILVYKDFADDLRSFRDGAGHGSHVLHDAHSTAPDAKFVIGRVMGDDGEGKPSDILRGLKWIQELKKGGLNITVVNMSMGGVPDGLPESFDAIDREIDALKEMGVKVVAAAGNEGPSEHSIGSPGDALGSITVGSARDREHVSQFSSRGPTDDGIDRPDIVCPGEYIAAPVPTYSEMYRTAAAVQKMRDMDASALKPFLEEKLEILQAFNLGLDVLARSPEELEELIKSHLPPTGLNDKDEVVGPGTSYSSPLAAGILASLDCIRPQTPDEARELIKGTADSIPGYSRIEQGAGFLNAEKALGRLRTQAD